jgi:hypothetical protein
MHYIGWLDIATFVVLCLGLAVQCLLFVGLVWYTIETRKIRKTSQQQVKASQDQIEATLRPCVTFSTATRDYNEAVFGMNGAVGAMTVLCPEGRAQIENVGFGPAVNVRYELTPTDLNSTRARPEGYLVGIRVGQVFGPPIPRGILANNEWRCIFTYESLSGRSHRTTVMLNNLVLTSFHVE